MSEHKSAKRVVHPSGVYAVAYCNCGSVTIQVGEMNFRLSEESFYEFSRTIGVGFEKISGESARFLGEMDAGVTRDSSRSEVKPVQSTLHAEEPDLVH